MSRCSKCRRGLVSSQGSSSPVRGSSASDQDFSGESSALIIVVGNLALLHLYDCLYDCENESYEA